MLDPQQALAAASRPLTRPTAVPRRVLVVGAGGSLGSAVLEQLLVSHHFQQVAALVEQPVTTAVRGFVAVPDSEAALRRLAADTALVVFDRERKAHGRELAFVRPQPAELLARARALHALGVKRLVVVVPHRAALLPMALQQGLANLDEAAVAQLGFEQLVFMRKATDGAGPGSDGDAGLRAAPERLASWMLSQLQWMAPQREQAVRPITVAKVAAAVAVQLGQVASATRVLPAQVLWHAAQQRDVAGTVKAWLDGVAQPEPPSRNRPRL